MEVNNTDKAILQRLKRLETGILPGVGVSLLELLADGSWKLSCGLSDGRFERSIYPTEAEGRMAYEKFLQKCRKGAENPPLIIIDI